MTHLIDEKRRDDTNLSSSRARDGVSENATSILAIDPPAIRCSDSIAETAKASAIAPPARTSRRGFLMNSLVSTASLATAAAVASATAIPNKPAVAATIPIAIDAPPARPAEVGSDYDGAACLARAEQAVEVLRTRSIRKGWKIDEEAAEQALAYFRRHPHACDERCDDDYYMPALRFFMSHGVSLDWILCGDIAGLICAGAKNSARADSVVDAELLALADEYLIAEKKTLDLESAVTRIDDDLILERRRRPLPDALRWRASDAEFWPEPPENHVFDQPLVMSLQAKKWPCSKIHTDDEISIRFTMPSLAARARADEILAAFEQWRQEVKPPRGYKKLVRERDKAWRVSARLLARVSEVPARTVAGLLAKAKCAVGPEQDIESASFDMVGNPAGDMALSIFDDLASLEKTA